MSEAQRYVWLNNFELPIRGAVSWKRITPFPAQFMTTAPTQNDYTPTRKQTWFALRGGLGKDKWTPRDNDRYADASIDASQEIQTLPSLITTLGSFGKEPVKLIKHDGKIWAVGHNQISYWTGSTWTSTKTDFPNPTDAILFYGTA
ncbi:hypothetical protein LCGC14_2967940 [marine sediment metagenome]|uniref:Uncharacterized protein n=1 Tax=marine sediment metagenome TaxID=412755 RepID=A0A0F8ZI07_9ZZZZ